MIYEAVARDAPIRQGDIFRNVPRVEVPPSKLIVVEDDGDREVGWAEVLATDNQVLTAMLPIETVTAIVVTQDCDAARCQDITLAVVDTFLAVSGQTAPSKPKSWASLITRLGRTEHRLFYLPASEDVGFDERMAADFRVVFQNPRTLLEEACDCRIGRINDVALEHFRESFAQYFRRYAYDDWYPLTEDERKKLEEARGEELPPFDWQK